MCLLYTYLRHSELASESILSCVQAKEKSQQTIVHQRAKRGNKKAP